MRPLVVGPRLVLQDALWVLPSLLLVGLPGCSPSGGDDYADRVAEEHVGDRPVASGAVESVAAGAVFTETVTYSSAKGRPVVGFLARPDRDAENAPGIIVIHEWWGLNDNVRAMAGRLAGLGFSVLAVDLYRGEVAEDANRARELSTAVSEREGEVEDDLRAAYRYLSEKLGAPRVGVIGWCFGGTWSLRTALLLPDEIDATVIYYGKLVTDRAKLEPLHMPILGIFGGQDQSIPVKTVREFETALRELGKNATIHVYENANHAFANPSGKRYDAEAAQDAWEKTAAFLEVSLRKG